MSKQQLKPLIASFYSYKGGTGRTTATANVACFLAKLGHKVACIDMDLEGPGLSILFNVKENAAKGLQYFFDESLSKFDLNHFIVNLANVSPKVTQDKSELLDISRNIFFVPASTQFKKNLDFSDGNKSIKKFNSLLDAINNEVNPDIIILDTPSGYGHLSALSLYLSDLLVVFFRWSRQHLLGTVKIREFCKENNLDNILVSSCVPEVSDKENRKKMYEEFVKPDCEINDDNELKWAEKMILFEDNSEKEFLSYKGYSQVANKICGYLRR